MTRADVEANPSVVTGTLYISSVPTLVLFDSGATHSFASTEYVKRLGRIPDVVEISYSVTVPSGDARQTDRILRACAILVEGRELHADLIVLDMNDYDVILGMDWLSKYGATINCKEKTVTFQLSGKESFTFASIVKNFKFPTISAVKAQ